MKRYLPLFFGVAFSFFGSAQTVNDYTLGLNNADAVITDGGVFFNDEVPGLPGYEIPSGSQVHSIFAMGFWYGGVDANGQLKFSGQKYENLADQFKGPLSNDGAANPPTSGTWTNALFPVTKEEILYHQANYMNPGYVVPPNIANWPAHGDVALNQDFYLAPFVDIIQDGTYDPTTGDYPCIRGDQAVYVIMNDKGGVHASGGDPIGIEMHYMFYEYTTADDVNNTTFVYGKVINRGTQTLNDFKISAFLDADIGFYGDDYFGSDSTRSLMYFYNGDNYDEPSASSAGYQMAPPAAGIVSLTHDFESMGFVEDAVASASAYWNAMNGKYFNGVPWSHPGSVTPVNFMYPDDLSDPNQTKTEMGYANAPGDRKGVATINFGTLTPSAVVEFDFAVLYNQDLINNIDNAIGLKAVADNVQGFFDATVMNDCIGSVVAINELTPVEFSIYPNPSNGEFTISLLNDFSEANINVYDISGRRVITQSKLTSKETIITINESTGVYFLHLLVDGQKSVKRILLE